MSSEDRNTNLPKVLLALSVFAAAIIVYYVQRGDAVVADPSNVGRNLVCSSCQAEFKSPINLDDSGSAIACPKCGAAAGWPLQYCSACDLKFPPPLIGDPPRPAPMPQCPKCGSNKSVGAYVPEFFEAMKETGQ
ncbi:MAG: hypothetical protein H6818_02480 [Phycisphaerales bacterium]|nr:hypothetical protein [Phycisphaerales bacterium]MCB9863181.1 hypothetical protein [Phycisphaerales bacterium]